MTVGDDLYFVPHYYCQIVPIRWLTKHRLVYQAFSAVHKYRPLLFMQQNSDQRAGLSPTWWVCPRLMDTSGKTLESWSLGFMCGQGGAGGGRGEPFVHSARDDV